MNLGDFIQSRSARPFIVAFAFGCLSLWQGPVNAAPESKRPSLVSLPGATIRIEPGSVVENQPAVKLPLSPGRDTRAYQMLLRSGELSVELVESTNPTDAVSVEGDKIVELPPTMIPSHALLVRTPDEEVAIVKRGKAMIRVENGKLVVVNYSGETLVGTPQTVRPLRAGYSVSPTCDAGRPHAIPAVPKAKPGGRVFLSVGGGVRPDSLAWQAVPSASLYHVDILSGGRVVASLNVKGTTLGSEAPELAAGTYAFQVRPIDGCGIPGLASTPDTFHVVGVKLPAGAFRDTSGRLRLQVNDALELSNAAGIQMTYEGLTQWVAVPEKLSLRREREERVLLRTSPGSKPSVLRLVPRGVRADITLGPNDVKWPRDSVNIKVTLRDEIGGMPEGWIEPKPVVTLGVSPIEVTWKKEGMSLSAVIAPREGEGPCVVRVEVKDQFGHSLGRNFLEIDRD